MAPVYHCTQVNIGEMVGEGSFGDVYKGFINSKVVAVKINKSADDNESRREVNRMKWLDHPNVVSLLGTVPPGYHSNGCVCYEYGYDTDSTWIIMGFAQKGNLDSFMSTHSGGIPAWGMIKVAYQVANGMWYLHNVANKVHMDLSARNVLVQDDHYNVKIGDYGALCNFTYTYGDYYYSDGDGNACPVRWMPPENFPNYGEKGSYTRKGDVWSFGVLLFEIWTRGKLPFGNLDNEDVMKVVRRGETVLDHYDETFNARSWVVNLMNECFQFTKWDRPNFRRIAQTIREQSEYDVDEL